MTQLSRNNELDRVFPAHPQVDRYFPGESCEEARRRLAEAIARGDGPGLLIGACGTGKSMLLEVLARQFSDRFDVASLSCAGLTSPKSLLQAVLFELGLPYRAQNADDLRLTLMEHLLAPQRRSEGLLLLVDEAQSLPPTLLEELRLLSNVMRSGQPCVRMVLAGSPSLDETFAAAELESFQQRLAARCYLSPLGRDETGQFVQAHLANEQVDFDADALGAVFEATDGVPRLINQLCDRALRQAQDSGVATINREAIQRTWADLQQLPTPWELAPPALDKLPVAEDDVVEFGHLDELGELSLGSSDPGPKPEQSSAEINDEPVDPSDRPAAEFAAEELLPIELRACGSPCAVSATCHPVATRDVPLPPAPPEVPTTQIHAADDDEFVEEVVLDQFASLSESFGSRAPRVENRCDHRMSALVRQALDSGMQDAGPTVDEFVNEVVDTDEVDTASATIRYPSQRPVQETDDDADDNQRLLQHESSPATGAGDILQVEVDDVPAEYRYEVVNPQVRRQAYSQLFANLRHQ